MRGGEAFEKRLSTLTKAMRPDDTDPEKRQIVRPYQSGFYLTVAALVLILSGFTQSTPSFNGVVFAFSLVGWIKAKSPVSRVSGVLLTGLSGGYLILSLRSWYF